MKTKVEVVLHIERDDLAQVKDLDEAFSLIGSDGLPDHEQAPFRHIRGNNFTWEDVEHAREVVTRKAKELIHAADHERCFVDPNLNAKWANGVRATAQLAMRKITQFITDLGEDLTHVVEAGR